MDDTTILKTSVLAIFLSYLSAALFIGVFILMGHINYGAVHPKIEILWMARRLILIIGSGLAFLTLSGFFIMVHLDRRGAEIFETPADE